MFLLLIGILRIFLTREARLEWNDLEAEALSAVVTSSPVDMEGPSAIGEFSTFAGGPEDCSARQEFMQDFTQPPVNMGCYALSVAYGPLAVGGWGMGTSGMPWLQAPAGQVWRNPWPQQGMAPNCQMERTTPWWTAPQDNPYAYMEQSSPLRNHLLPSMKVKIWHGEYVDIFTLLFRDLEMKPGMKDDPQEHEKIICQQVDKNFADWLYCLYYLYGSGVAGPALKGSCFGQVFGSHS